MKKYFLILFALHAMYLSAQPWLYDYYQGEGKLKSSGDELSLKDHKKVFDQYWESRSYEKGKGYKQFLRWYHFMEPRVGEGNSLNNRALLDALLEKQQTKGVGNVTWTPAGPTETSYTLSNNLMRGNGRLNCIAFHPTDPLTIYVGAPTGGVWKTTDGGQSWNTTSDFLSAIGVSDIVVSHENPNNIFVATGDRDGSSAYAIGILKSIDGGETWATTSLSVEYNQRVTFNRMLMHPNDAKIMWATSTNGIYKTTDGWKSYSLILEGENFRDLELNPSNPGILLATHRSALRTGTIWRSTDGGQSFYESTAGMTGLQ
ncbi:MAG: hypothetical protein MI922_23410, partial [Bacteroidales bacterium]|nr:hypothetical protein [Bacteroidales bacterium]